MHKKSMDVDVLSHLTRERLAELESRPKTPVSVFLDYTVCLMPVIFGLLALAEYLFVPNLKGNTSTSTYTYFLTVLISIAAVYFLARVWDGVLMKK